MASPALEIAQKTSDVGLQMWAALLVKGEVFSVAEYFINCILLFSDLQQMSGDLSGEAMSRSIIESASKHISKGKTNICGAALHLLVDIIQNQQRVVTTH